MTLSQIFALFAGVVCGCLGGSVGLRLIERAQRAKQKDGGKRE